MKRDHKSTRNSILILLSFCLLFCCLSGCVDVDNQADGGVMDNAEESLTSDGEAAFVYPDTWDEYFLIKQLHESVGTGTDAADSGRTSTDPGAVPEENTGKGVEEDSSIQKSPSSDDLRCTDIAAGMHHSLFLLSDGRVIGIGSNKDGQCNTQDWTDIIAVAAGYFHSVGLKSDGTVVAVGRSSDHALEVEDWTDIVSIGAGLNGTVGLDREGNIHLAGYCGRTNQETFDESHVASFYIGEGSALNLVYDDGSFYMTGKKGLADSDREVIERFRAKNGQYRYISMIKSLSNFILIGINSEGSVTAVGDEQAQESLCLNIDGMKDVIQVAAGGDGSFCACLKEDGTVFACGNNDFGQCNVGEWSNITRISVYGTKILGLRSDGKVLAAGTNQYGECSIPQAVLAADVIQPASPQFKKVQNTFSHEYDYYYGEVGRDENDNYWPAGFVVLEMGGDDNTNIGFNYCDSYPSKGAWSDVMISLYRNGEKEVDSIGISKIDGETPKCSTRFWKDGRIYYMDYTKEPDVLYKKEPDSGNITANTVTGFSSIKGEPVDTGDLTGEDLETMGFLYEDVDIYSKQNSHENTTTHLQDGIYSLTVTDEEGEKITLLRVEIDPEGNVGVDYKGTKWGFDTRTGSFLGTRSIPE